MPTQGCIRANVQPIPPNFPGHEPSTSKRDSSLAYASPILWGCLRWRSSSDSKQTERLGVAVEFPEDRRLGKGKAKQNVVLWVAPFPVRSLAMGRDFANVEIKMEKSTLYLPAHLIPAYSSPPISVKLYRHDPIPLSLVVLQEVLEYEDESSASDDSQVSIDDLELDLTPTRPIGSGGTPNDDSLPSLASIIRQDDFLHLRQSSRRLHVQLTEPVLSGLITSSTRIVLSSVPWALPTPIGALDATDEGEGASEHSVPRTHLSAMLEEFDPDAFLSSSLTLPSGSPSVLPDGPDLPIGEDPAGSWSSSSGSLTPRPGASPLRAESPPRSAEEVLNGDLVDGDQSGVRFGVVVARGPAPEGAQREVAYMGIAGLGRAGIFEGDWVIIRPSDGGGGRLVKVEAFEMLDEPRADLPVHPILLSPALWRALFPNPSTHSITPQVSISPTPFGARTPTLPIASTITLARIATTEGVDKRYEKSWIRALKAHFSPSSAALSDGEEDQRLVRPGDIIAVPVARGRPLPEHIPEGDPGALLSDSDSDSSDDDDNAEEVHSPLRFRRHPAPDAVAYFVVTSLSFDPLVPLEEDFHSSLSSKARSGELGCWVDVGTEGSTRMVLAGLEKMRIHDRSRELDFLGLPIVPSPFSPIGARMRDLLRAALLSPAISLSILLKGARGAGKTTTIRSIANELGFNVVLVPCYDIVGDTAALTEGSIRAALEKASSAAPSILLLHCIEALATKSDAPHSRPPAIVKVLEDALGSLRKSSSESGFPAVLIGTTRDGDKVEVGVAGVFKQELEIGAPDEGQRLQIASACFDGSPLSPEVRLSTLASQTAALHAIDIVALSLRSQDLALARVQASTYRSLSDIRLAGYAVSSSDIDRAAGVAREAYGDRIGAPKIPNVHWDDIGGLASVKREILETIQLPLDHPELFGAGLKKRSGILLYGPPGTGKTLLAKAVASSCSLNFFSVKGPELLNMYVGESEANVRRIFQRARDASPCVVFMDELDSVAPKRGNQGDSGGVMDRIVAQLLAELDGMSSGSGAAQVFVMGATNRPDLLDPALLRPGRFDRMIYLSAPTTHHAQAEVLRALTRKFHLEKGLDLEEVATSCPINYTGADLYAVASDAMLKAMMRTAERVDERIAALEPERERARSGANGAEKEGGNGEGTHGWPSPLTPQYYLSRLASPDEYKVTVGYDDFQRAIAGTRPSVSEEEMRYYESVQKGFRGVEGQENGTGVEGYQVNHEGEGHDLEGGEGRFEEVA